MGRPRTIEDDAILGATRDVIVKRGLSVSLKTIARAAGVSDALLIQRFRTKKRLLRSAMAFEPTDADAVVAKAATSRSPLRALEEVACAILEEFRSKLPALVPLIADRTLSMSGMLSAPESPFILFSRALERYLDEEIAAGRLAVRAVHPTAFVLISALHTAALLEALEGRQLVPHEVIRRSIRQIWRGLAPKE